MNKILLTIVLFLLTLAAFGQQKNDVIQQRIEFISEELEIEDMALEDVFDILYYYYDHPLNLNTAKREDLQELLLINDIQINELLERIRNKGPFETMFELQEMEFWDLLTIENILPFTRVAPISEKKEKESGRLKKYLKEGKTEIYMRWQRVPEEKQGYADVPDSVKEQSNAYYWGSPDRVYSRIRFTHKRDLSVGVTMEKDAGEELFGTTQPYGFDFYSAHAYYNRNTGFLRTIAVGDYQMELGQGVAMWTGYAFNKTVDATRVRKNARGIRPYASVDELRFLRGAAAEFGVGDFSLTTFFSQKGVDGSIQFANDSLSDDEEARLATSINLSGLHRTNSELARKNSLQERIYGGNLKYVRGGFNAGVSAIQHEYDTPLQRADRLVNQYEFSGDELTLLAADYSFIARNLSFFGEVAQSSTSRSFGWMQGALLALGRNATLTAIYRDYAKDYHTFYARGFGNSARPINESGIYVGGAFRLNDAWTLNVYADKFKSPWLRFRIDAPSEGHDILAQLKYRPTPRLEMFFRVREQNRMQNARGDYDGPLRPVENFVQRVYRMSFSYRIAKDFIWKSRVDYVTDERQSLGLQQGFSIAQDLVYRAKNKPLQIAVRYAIFDTDGFDVRIFNYEYHLQNVFSIPVYFNQGSRYYAMLKYNFFDGKMDLWLRYGSFVFANQGSLGAGPERIDGNTRSEVAVQIRIRF
jgi:hypothetical protein